MPAKTLTPKDAHALMNALVAQATGASDITVVDTSSFVSAGETVLASGVDNTLNSLAIIMGRTMMAVRPYQAKLQIINALNTNMYTNRMRKISLYARDNVASGDFNTDAFTNLKTGFTNGQNDGGSGAQSTKSMWEQNQPIPLDMNFSGQDVWETSTTIYEDQLKVAFRSEAEFGEFVAGIMTEKGNDIESTKEAFNRMTVLNHIAGVYDMSDNMPGSVVNLTKAYNDKFGTSYTSEQLRSTYLQSFLAFFVAEFKLASRYMQRRSTQYHWSPAKTDGAGNNVYLLRHTPADKQRVMLYEPLFIEAQANVLPEIFNPEYLDINTQYEAVDYWQSITSPSAINVTPAIPDLSDGTQKAGEAVYLPYVVGMIFDADAIMTDFQLETANTTPLEARKRFRNIWWSFSKNAINDFTEKCIIFIMEDED